MTKVPRGKRWDGPGPDAIEPCGECGEKHVTPKGWASCVGHTTKANPRGPGHACLAPRMKGQTICQKHGGRAPQNLAKAQERIERAEAERQAAQRLERLASRTLGAPVLDKDPAEIIGEQIAWRYGHVQWLRRRVQALDPQALVWGRTREKIGGDDGGLTREARPNAWYALYVEASRDLEKLCIEAIRAGLEERRVRLAEMQAEVLVQVIDGLLLDLGHDPNDPQTAELVERRLRVVGE